MILSVMSMALLLIHPTLAIPPAKTGNPGVPGLLAEIAELNEDIDDLNDQINALQSLAQVPQTGQTTSYETGDDGDLQRGLPWPNPRFIDNEDGTVTDNLTQLIWLKDASCMGYTAWADALTQIGNLNTGTDFLALSMRRVLLTTGACPI